MPRSQRDDLDLIIGANMRRLRLARSMTQTALGVTIDVSFQQIQKYEKAINSIRAADLARLAVALRCSLGDFFKQGGPEAPIPSSNPAVADSAKQI